MRNGDIEKLLDEVNEQVSICAADSFELLYANKEAIKLFVKGDADYSGMTCHKFFVGLDEPCPYCPVMKMTPDDQEYYCEVENGEFVFEVCVKKLIWEGRPAFAEFVHNITDVKKANDRYAENMKLILQSVPNARGIHIFDLKTGDFKNLKSFEHSQMAEGKYYIEDYLKNVYTYVPEAADRLILEQAFSRDALLKSAQSGTYEITRDIRYALKNKKHWGRVTAKILPKGQENEYDAVVFIVDVDAEYERLKKIEHMYVEAEKRASEARTRFEQLSYLDKKTGCLNREGLIYYMKSILTNYSQNYYGIVGIDIKNLTYINNTYGQDLGDAVIASFGEILHELIGTNERELVCHNNGGTFYLFTEYGSMGEKIDHKSYSERFLAMRDAFLHRFNFELDIKAYFGLYIISPNEIYDVPVEQMIQNAFLAVQEAKKDDIHSHLVFFNPAEWEKQKRTIEISSRFEQAISDDEIYVCYQPQFSNETNQILGAEVLCRWNSSALGAISPSEFIPVFETSGKITMLDEHVWQIAIKQLRKWIDEGRNPVPISINVSRLDIIVSDVKETLIRLLEKYDVPINLIRLEITESAYVENSNRVIECIKGLRAYGFTVEMDDFGSGYSSLNMLKKFPVDVVKLDMKFVSDEDHFSENTKIILSSVINMIKNLNMSVIAEGVETAEQNQTLKEMGCKVIQGYYYSRPLEAGQFAELLK